MPAMYQMTRLRCCAAFACLASSTSVGARTTEVDITQIASTLSKIPDDSPAAIGSSMKATADSVLRISSNFASRR